MTEKELTKLYFRWYSLGHPDTNDVAHYYINRDRDLVIIHKDGRVVLSDPSDTDEWTMDLGYEFGEDMDEERWLFLFRVRLKRKMFRQFYMDQNRFANELGVSQGTVSNYLNGRSKPSAYILMRMAKVFDCPIEDFLYPYCDIDNDTYILPYE